MQLVEELSAQGHVNVTARHSTTFEITRDTNLTSRGDCVIAVNASKGPRDLSAEFRNLCSHNESRILLELEVGGIVDSIEGRGSPKLTFSHSREMVGRKSSYVSLRTIMIRCNKAARDLDRELIHALTSPNSRLIARITVEL